jgi:hypothetical protein
MLCRIVAILLALSAAPPALALEACFSQSIGSWRGPVWNRLGLQNMDSDFEIAPDGTLLGHYRIHDAVAFDGTLTDFRQTGACEADFVWHDRDGSGVVHIRFEPELGRFIGTWGDTAPNPALVFNGYRFRPDVVSSLLSGSGQRRDAVRQLA